MSDGTPGSFVGTGWAFPPEFGPGGAEVATVSGVEDVHQSLAILFATRPGERPMQESYGCALDDVMFEEVDHALLNRVAAMVNDAILKHEPRIRLDDLDVSPDANDPATLLIRLAYTVLGTNSRYNMVFPFYLQEAVAPGIG